MFLSLPLLQRPTSVQALHCWYFTWCGSPCPLWGSPHLVSPQGRCWSGRGSPAGLLCYPAWPSPYFNRIPQTVGNPGPETAVLFACKCDRWLSLQISLANLKLKTTADSLGVLELDTNEVTTKLPGGLQRRKRSWEAAAEFRQTAHHASGRTWLVRLTQCQEMIAHRSVFFSFSPSYVQL